MKVYCKHCGIGMNKKILTLKENKYQSFINDLNTIGNLKGFTYKYNNAYDSIYLYFNDKAFSLLDNDESEEFIELCYYLDKHNLKCCFHPGGLLEVENYEN